MQGTKLGLITDAHGRTEKIDAIRAKHPEINQWIFLGDLFDFMVPNRNRETGKWLRENINNYSFVMGNHDYVVAGANIEIDAEDSELIKANFFNRINVVLPSGNNLFCCHAKPQGLWDFINPGYTEREFQDDFLGHFKENTIAAAVGHTHTQMKYVFPYEDAEIWNVGPAFAGQYAIVENDKIEFKKL